MGLKRTDGGSLKVMILVVEVAVGEERRLARLSKQRVKLDSFAATSPTAACNYSLLTYTFPYCLPFSFLFSFCYHLACLSKQVC